MSVSQFCLNKEWDINKESMDTYIAEIRKLEKKFSGLEIHHVVRDNNVAADVLSKLGSDRAEVPPGIFVHELHHPSINISTPMEVDLVPQGTSREVVMIEADWRTTFIDYIKNKVLPPGIKKDDAEAVRIMRRSKNYVLVDNKLYKRGVGSGMLMKCVTAEEGKGILQEAHEGTCRNHAASRTLVGKVFRSGFYWPTALSDTELLVKRCLGCQYFSK
ncbi:uncharacterized protein LOC120701943 [Panicum virgatum]|uniref:uncharacterized protein LOC120701943 n=1 Tax=Panicum virgatum TaxID=38727 RepID=UPI0019D5F8D7|nr:uncharacterized protein LOC120701943 [Panicum virgatum]